MLAGVLLLAAISVGLQTEVFSRQTARALERVIAGLTGERAMVGGVRVDLIGRRAVVEGITLSEISEDPEKDGQTILAVERVQLVAGWRDGRPNLRLLEVVRPVVRLHLDGDGLREFRELRPGAPRPPDAPPPELPWERLRVVDGSFTLLGPRFSVEAESVWVSPDRRGRLDVDIGRLSLQSGGVAQIAHRVRLSEVGFAPDELVIPSLSMAFRPERPRLLPDPLPGQELEEAPPGVAELPSLAVEGSLAARRGGALEGDLAIRGRLEGWNAALPPRLAAQGALVASLRLGGHTERPELGGDLRLEGARLLQRGKKGDLHAYDPGEVDLCWRLDGRVLRVEPLVQRVAGGTLTLNGTLDLQTLGVYASVVGEDLSFADVLVAVNAARHPWIDFNADLEAEVAGTLDPLALAGSFDVAAKDLLVTAGPQDQPQSEDVLAVPRLWLGGELRLDAESVRLDAHELQSGRTRGRAVARIGLSGLGPLDLRLSLDPVDLTLLRPLADLNLNGVGGLVGHLSGPFDDLHASATLDVRDFAVLDIPFADELSAELESDLRSIDFPRFQARKGRSRYSGSLLVDLSGGVRLDTNILLADAWISDIAGMFLEIPGLDGHVEGTLSLSGDPFLLDGEADLALDRVDLFGERFPEGFARGWMDQGRFTLDDLVLLREGGAESVLARGTVKEGWRSHFEVVGGGLRLERLTHLPEDLDLRGELGVDMQVEGVLFEPEPRGRVALRDTWLFGQPVDDSTLRFQTEAGVLSFAGELAGPGLTLDGTLGLWGEQPYEVHGRLNNLPLHVLYPVAQDGQPVSARASGEVDLRGSFGDVPLPLDLRARLDHVELAWGGHRLVNPPPPGLEPGSAEPAPWRYTQLGSSFKIEDVALAGGATELRLGGWRNEDGTVAFAGGGPLDLDLLRAVVPDLTRAEGVAQLSVSALGSSEDPIRPVVDLSFTDATLRGTWFPHPFEGLSASITGTPSGYELVQEAEGRLGGGEFTLGGRIEARDWVPTAFDLSAAVSGARVQYLDYLPPFVGDAALSFDGPTDALLLSGTIDIRSMLFSDRIDWETWVLELADERLTSTASEETANYFSMDLAIRAEDTVRVRNNVGDLAGSADLRVIGDTSRVGLLGTVRMDPGGRVYFKEREFELTRGEIRFVEPYAFDPDLDIALETSVRSREQEYDVNLWLNGPYSAWNTTASSQPALPQSDINALLLFGMTQEELERYGGLSAALALEGGDLLASRFGLLERAGEGVFKLELFRLDRVDLASGVSERGRGLVSSEIRLLAEKDLGWDTTLILEQNLSRTSDTYIGFDKQLARTLYMRAYWASQQYGRSLPIGGAYGLDVNLRWELD